MELVAELIDPPGLFQESQQYPESRVLPPFLENVVIGNPGILEQFFKDVLLLDQHFNLMAMCFQGRDGVLVVMEVGRVAEIDKDSHRTLVFLHHEIGSLPILIGLKFRYFFYR